MIRVGRHKPKISQKNKGGLPVVFSVHGVDHRNSSSSSSVCGSIYIVNASLWMRNGGLVNKVLLMFLRTKNYWFYYRVCNSILNACSRGYDPYAK